MIFLINWEKLTAKTEIKKLGMISMMNANSKQEQILMPIAKENGSDKALALSCWSFGAIEFYDYFCSFKAILWSLLTVFFLDIHEKLAPDSPVTGGG